jgi:hypothetical protein
MKMGRQVGKIGCKNVLKNGVERVDRVTGSRGTGSGEIWVVEM